MIYTSFTGCVEQGGGGEAQTRQHCPVIETTLKLRIWGQSLDFKSNFTH